MQPKNSDAPVLLPAEQQPVGIVWRATFMTTIRPNSFAKLGDLPAPGPTLTIVNEMGAIVVDTA
jgi:hypothetical protein